MANDRADVLDQIATRLLALEPSHPLRVAVDGITAAGKTTFADELAEVIRAHRRRCDRITMDGFHHPSARRYRRGRESADGYYEDAYDFVALRREVLDPLGPGGRRAYRLAVIDLATDAAVSPEPVALPADAVALVDGSFLQRPELDGAWDVVIFLLADFDVAKARGVARDSARLGRDGAERLFDVRYHAAQRRYLTEVAPADRADIVVDHTDPARPSLVR